MKHQWLAYVIVGVLSIGAGVAIAGLPNNVPVDATISPPTTTVLPEPTIDSAVTSTTTTGAKTPTTAPETTDVEPAASTEPNAVETTDAASSIVARSEISVIAANGADVAGAASRMVRRLVDTGYVDVQSRDGTQPVDFTTVYYADGFDAAALRMAEDLDLAPEFVATIDDAPSVLDLPDLVELLVYIGVDRA